MLKPHVEVLSSMNFFSFFLVQIPFAGIVLLVSKNILLRFTILFKSFTYIINSFHTL